MIEINLNRSQFLLPLLQKMVSELTQLSSSDSALNQKIYELHHFLSAPEQVDGDELLRAIDETKDLASSYEVKKYKGPDSFVKSLPSLFYAARAEAEHMVKSKKLSGQGTGKRQAQLELDIERFYKLATALKAPVECPQCSKILMCPAVEDDEGTAIDVPANCPHCGFPVSDAYDNIGFGGDSNMYGAAIIFVNADLSAQVQSVLQTQLYITEAMTGAEFDARVLADPYYPKIVHEQGLRILVIRPFWDRVNRCEADVIIFVKAGLASIESNKLGPPGHTLPVAELTVHKLLTRFPPIDFQRRNKHIQNNILYPLHPHAKDPAVFPFGSDRNPLQDTIFLVPPGVPFRAKGALIPRCDDDDDTFNAFREHEEHEGRDRHEECECHEELKCPEEEEEEVRIEYEIITDFTIESFTGGLAVECGATVTNPVFAAVYSNSVDSASIVNTDGIGSPLVLAAPYTSGTVIGSFSHTGVNDTVTFTLSAHRNVFNKLATQAIIFEGRSFVGLGAAGATGATISGNTAVLNSGLGTLSDGGIHSSDVGQSYGPFSPITQKIYLLLPHTSTAHTFRDQFGFFFVVNPPTTFSVTNQNGATISMDLYESTNLLSTPFTVTVSS